MKTALKLAKKSMLQILECVSVETDGTLTANNLDHMIKCPSGLANGIYVSKVLKTGIVIRSAQEISDYPQDIVPNADDVIVESSLTLEDIETLKWVVSAAGTEESRHYLRGVCFKNRQVTSTDGHRLHQAPLAFAIPAPHALIVSTRAIELLYDMAKEYKVKTVEVTFYKAHAVFTCGLATLTTRLVDGTFPDTNQVIPALDTSAKQAILSPETFANILPQVKALGPKDKNKISALRFENDACSMIVCMSRGEPDSQTVHTFPNVALNLGYPVGFNPEFLAEACSGIMYANDSGSPHRIDGDKGKLAVLMPIRV
jgi:DNA polymerase-3 subunit beta